MFIVCMFESEPYIYISQWYMNMNCFSLYSESGPDDVGPNKLHISPTCFLCHHPGIVSWRHGGGLCNSAATWWPSGLASWRQRNLFWWWPLDTRPLWGGGAGFDRGIDRSSFVYSTWLVTHTRIHTLQKPYLHNRILQPLPPQTIENLQKHVSIYVSMYYQKMGTLWCEFVNMFAPNVYV